MSRFAVLVVVNAESSDDADRLMGNGIAPLADDFQYVSPPWPVAENDGSYDFESVIGQGIRSLPVTARKE